jgi:uncharacterized membrane protein (DUF106 family)
MKKGIVLGICLCTVLPLVGGHLDLRRNNDIMESRIKLLETTLKSKQEEITKARADKKSAAEIKRLEEERAKLIADIAVAHNSLQSLKKLKK